MSKATFDPTQYNKSQNEPFASILEKRYSRRDILKGGAAMTALTLFSGFGLTGCNDDDNDSSGSSTGTSLKLGFDSIPGPITDAITVAAGYTAQVLAPWGTHLNSQVGGWKDDGTNTSFDQANSVGMNNLIL